MNMRFKWEMKEINTSYKEKLHNIVQLGSEFEGDLSGVIRDLNENGHPNRDLHFYNSFSLLLGKAARQLDNLTGHHKHVCFKVYNAED